MVEPSHGSTGFTDANPGVGSVGVGPGVGGKVGNGDVRSATLGPATKVGGRNSIVDNSVATLRRNSTFMQNGNHQSLDRGGGGGGGGGGGLSAASKKPIVQEEEEPEIDPLRRLTQHGSKLFEAFRAK